MNCSNLNKKFQKNELLRGLLFTFIFGIEKAKLFIMPGKSYTGKDFPDHALGKTNYFACCIKCGE